MSTNYQPEPQFDFNAYQRELANQPRSKASRWFLGALLVGLGFLFLGGIVVVGGACYVASNLDRWLVGLGREAIVAMINESEIPDEEKAEVITQVDRVVTAYKERKINQDDLQKALAELDEAPAMKVLLLYGLDELFLTGDSLTEDEVAAGRRSYERALRGVYEGKLTEEDLYAVLPLDDDDALDRAQNSASEKTDGDIKLVANNKSEPATDDDVRESIVKLKVLVDNARIPDESFQLDIGDEIKKIVDRLLEGKE